MSTSIRLCFFLVVYMVGKSIVTGQNNGDKKVSDGYGKTTKANDTKGNVTTPRSPYSRLMKEQFKKLVMKPKLPFTYQGVEKAPFHPAWMDYCDPYHCNDYHRQVCGLNRKNLRFRYFQSGCHIILHNQCSNFRGTLKYDQIELKFCRVYVMFLRQSCPTDCSEEEVDPVCAYSTTRGHVVLFLNYCALDASNCRNSSTVPREFEAVQMTHCENILKGNKLKRENNLISS